MGIESGLYSGRMKKSLQLQSIGVPHSFICYIPSDDCNIQDIRVFHVTPNVEYNDTLVFVDENGNQAALKIDTGNYLLKANKENQIEKISYIRDQEGANNRLFDDILKSGQNQFTSNKYDVFANNCEQFTNYVATGDFRSQSWQTFRNVTGLFIAGIALLAGGRQQA